MAQDIYTMTPGSAVADSIQEILARRRDMARQAMLDKLQQDRVQDEMATNEMQRKQLAEAIISSKLWDVPDETDLSTLDPDLAKEARSRGMFTEETPQVTSSASVSLPDGSTAADNPPPVTTKAPSHAIFTSGKYREKKLGEADFAKYIAEHPELAKSNPELAQVLMMNAQGIGATPTPEMLNPAPSVTPYDEKSGKFGAPQQLARGGQPLMRGYPPFPPSAYMAPQQVVMQNPQDGNKPWSYWIIPGQDRTQAKPIAPYDASNPSFKFGTYDQNTPNASSAANPRISQALDNLSKASNVVGPDQPSRIATARQEVIVEGLRALSPAGQQALNEVVTRIFNPQTAPGKAARKPTINDLPGIINWAKSNHQLTPQDEQTLTAVLQGYLSVPF